jgi:DNA-binding HxlR family transcriptional regulator
MGYVRGFAGTSAAAPQAPTVTDEAAAQVEREISAVELTSRAMLSEVSLRSKSIEAGGGEGCPIAAALDIVGDRWSLLVLRDLSRGVHRFSDIQAKTGAPRDRLTSRLRALEEAGVIARQRYSEHPPRDEYVLTDAGRAIAPVLDALETWGENYAF